MKKRVITSHQQEESTAVNNKSQSSFIYVSHEYLIISKTEIIRESFGFDDDLMKFLYHISMFSSFNRFLSEKEKNSFGEDKDVLWKG